MKCLYSFLNILKLSIFSLVSVCTGLSLPLTCCSTEGQGGGHVAAHDYIYLHIFHCAAVQLVFMGWTSHVDPP